MPDVLDAVFINLFADDTLLHIYGNNNNLPDYKERKTL